MRDSEESGIRNQESGIRIPVKMWAIRQIRNQESGIKWSIKNIGRGEQNQELALAALGESERKQEETRMENQEAESGAKMGESGERIRISEQKRNLGRGI